MTDTCVDKENDVVARAKLEAKKKFSAESSEAQRQEWIEQRIKEDYERLLNRLAAQLHGEIGHLRPFQLGFADYYFAENNWPPGFDPQTLLAGRILSGVLPGLTESQVTETSQTAANSLITALEVAQPYPNAILAGIRILSENTEVLAGIDKVLTYLFAPKTGPSLARKRPGEQSLSSANSTSPLAAKPQQAPPVWHRKEPATLQNPIRPPLAPPRSYSAYTPHLPESVNPAEREAKQHSPTPAHPSYTQYPPHPPYSRPPHQSPPYVGPLPPPHPLSLQYSQAYLPTSMYPLNMQQQAPPYHAITSPVPYSHSANSPSFSNSHSGVHDYQPSTGAVQGTDDMLKSPAMQGSTVIINTLPGTPSIQTKVPIETHDDSSALETLIVDGSDDLRTSAPAESKRLSENAKPRPSLAPATPESHSTNNFLNATSPTHHLNVDGTIDEDTIEVYDQTRSKDTSPSSKISRDQPAPRFPTRDRKPAARALSANLTSSLLSTGPNRPKNNALVSQSSIKVSAAVASLESTTGNASDGLDSASLKSLTKNTHTSQSLMHENPTETVNVPPAVPSLEPEEPAQPRSSGRERKPTAKALALTSTARSRKRSASTIDSPSPPKAAKISKSARKEPSILRFPSMSPDELGAPATVVAVKSPESSVSTTKCASNHQDSEQFQTITYQNSEALSRVTIKSAEKTSPQKERGPAFPKAAPKISLHMPSIMHQPETSTNDTALAANKRAASNDTEERKQERQHLDEMIPPRSDVQNSNQSIWGQSSKSLKIQQTTSSLLAFAAIAEEWSDSDDDGDVSLESEQRFKTRLANALGQFSNLEKISKPRAILGGASNHSPGATNLSKTETLFPGSQKIFIPQVNTILKAWDSRMASQILTQLSNDDPELICHDIVEISGAEVPSAQAAESILAKRTQAPDGMAIPLNGSTEPNFSQTGKIYEFAGDAAPNGVFQHPPALQSPGEHRSMISITPLPAMVSGTGCNMSRQPTPSKSFTPVNASQSELRIAKIDTIETPPANSKTSTRSSGKPASTNGSRFKIDPRGLNGQRPGGGTIINARETQEAQQERRRGKATLEKTVASSGHVSPAIPRAKFNKGGSLMSFSQFIPSKPS
jgi:hypothetical protein